MIFEPTAEQRMNALKHELAKWLWIARCAPINRLECEDNLRTLVSLCPVEISEKANKLMHDVKQQLTKLHGRAQLLTRGIDPMIRCSALRMREFKN